MSFHVAQPYGRAIPLATLMRLNGQRVQRRHRRVRVLEDPVCFSVNDVAYTIGAGALTDLASAPWFTHWAINPLDDPWTTCATIHDHGFAELAHSRKQADRWWRECALSMGVTPALAWGTWLALRVGSWPAWRSNRQQLAKQGARWRYLKEQT